MKKIYLISSILFLAGCVTTNVKNEDAPQIITLPKGDKRVEIENLKQAKANKIKIGEKFGNVFEFYPGPRGSYYFVISPKDPKKNFMKMDLSLYDAVLEVDKDGENPETLTLALEYNQLYSGFGIIREGLTKYNLKLSPIDKSMGNGVSFEFKVKMQGF